MKKMFKHYLKRIERHLNRIGERGYQQMRDLTAQELRIALTAQELERAGAKELARILREQLKQGMEKPLA